MSSRSKPASAVAYPTTTGRSFSARTGGYREPQDIEAADGSNQWSINVLLGLSRHIQSSNIESVLEDVRETIPAGYMPIAVGDGGEIDPARD